VPRIDGREVVLDTTFITQVSLAVVLADSATNAPAIGGVRVLLQELAQEGRLTPSGYFLFVNIRHGLYTVRVAAEHYLDEEVALGVPASPPESPVVTILLHPRPSYPFPPGTTLVRGLVRDAADKPVADARVDIVGRNIANHSVHNGEFVLPFGALREQDVIRVNRKTFVKGNGDQNELTSPPTPPTLLTVRATHPSHGTVTTTTEVQEGTTAFVRLVY
jgi:hypothetical protein